MVEGWRQKKRGRLGRKGGALGSGGSPGRGGGVQGGETRSRSAYSGEAESRIGGKFPNRVKKPEAYGGGPKQAGVRGMGSFPWRSILGQGERETWRILKPGGFWAGLVRKELKPVK